MKCKLIFLGVFLSQSAFAAGWGFSLARIQLAESGGFRASVTTPYFHQGHSSLELGGDFLSKPSLVSQRYELLDFGYLDVHYIASMYVGILFRAYAKVGLGALLPNSEFSSHVAIAGDLSLGAEYLPREDFAVLAELGTIYSFARAERELHQPYYANGLLFSLGVRFYIGAS